MKLFTTSFFLLLNVCVFGQTNIDDNAVDIAHINDSIFITKQCHLYVDSLGTATPANIPDGSWQPWNFQNQRTPIPNRWITKTIFLRFTLTNNSDSVAKVFFLPGNYIRSFNAYTIAAGRQITKLNNLSRSDGFQPFVLNARQQETYVTELRFTRRIHNYLAPQLISDAYLLKYKKILYHENDEGQRPIGFVLSGILLMMIFFTCANYMHSRKKEFLYNCCYSVCMFVLVFITTFIDRRGGVLASLFREYFDFMLLGGGTVFYIAFTRKFLETKTRYPLLNTIFVYEEKFLLLILAMFTYVLFLTDNFLLQDLLENSMKVIVLVVGIVYIVIALSQKNKLMNYLAVGNALLIFFSTISLLLILFPVKDNSIFSSSMVYYEIGVVGELICFLLGLTYKNRIELIEKIKEQESLKLEAEKLSFQTKLAIINAQQAERNRISADMHDDLGAGVTAIRLYSELAKKKVGIGTIPEIDKISSSANDLLNNMNAIIWTMSSSNDTLDNMVAYIRSYALEYFENTGIECYTKVDEDLPNIPVSGEIRRNIYLVVKETLNNILKHARAKEVHISLKKVPDGLSLYIHDNGAGIDMNNLRRFGNGLINMKKRMEESNISFDIENKEGTLITLHYKLEV
ncbi:MAG: 7TM diverse intracellular signaling domain-containing protein [Ferruginibacter sp.]